MSFRDTVFKIIKKIKLDSKRKNICQLFNSVIKKNKDSFNSIVYVAQRQNAQFASFLAIDDNRDKLNHDDNPFKISPLPKNLRQVFEDAHNDVVLFNNACFKFIDQDIESCRQALDPYRHLKFKFNPKRKLSGLLKEEYLEQMSKEFKKTKPVQNLLKKSVKGLDNINSVNLAEVTFEIRKKILETGVSNVPQDIIDLLLSQRKEPQIIWGRLILDIISILSMIEICDQLIYQAVFDDNLPILNENNIIYLDSITDHVLGRGIAVECQPNSNIFFNTLNKVIQVNFKIKERKFHDFCRVEEETISFSQDYGNSIKMKLRYLDDELNPFYNIYRKPR